MWVFEMPGSDPFEKSPLTSRLHTTEGLRKCRTHGLHYDPAVYKGCIICRSRALDSTDEKQSRLPMYFLLLLCVGAVAIGIRYGAPDSFERMVFAMRSAEPQADPVEEVAPETADDLAEEEGCLSAEGSPQECTSEMSGELLEGRASYFLPLRTQGQRLPLLVLLHGPDVSGRHMLNLFQALASEKRFAIVAPESGRVASGELAWQVADHAGELTTDGKHVLEALDELDALPGVVFDRARTTIAGHSLGAGAACDLATNHPEFSSFALLHGAAYRKTVGPRHVRGWVSTGRADPIYSMNDATRNVAELRASGNDVVLHSFPGGHAISTEEAKALVDWWLQTR